MGMGKSEFVRGLARVLGIQGPVPSPSFTIMKEYDEGSIPLYHFDWYRINDAEEIYEMGMDESLGGDGIALVEWHTRASDALPPDTLEIQFATCGDDARTITILQHGAFLQLAWEALTI